MASAKRHASIGLAAPVLVLACSFPVLAFDEIPVAPEPRGDAAAGEPLYEHHCAACHGPRGRGDGQQGRAFDPGPPDFRAVEADAKRFYTATRYGGMAVGASAAMPAFRHTLSEQQTHDVIAHLMQLVR